MVLKQIAGDSKNIFIEEQNDDGELDFSKSSEFSVEDGGFLTVFSSHP